MHDVQIPWFPIFQGDYADVNPGCIVLLHSISDFARRTGLPATEWDSKAFTAKGDVVVGTVALENWEPSYMNLLSHLVNVPSPAIIDTALAATSHPILLDLVADVDARATEIQDLRTIYMTPLFVPILLARKLSPVEA